MNIGHEYHHVYCGDCITLMQSWANQFHADLIFADPPFNIGQAYDAHNDSMSEVDFIRFNEQWISAAARLLKPNGILAINVPDAMVGYVLSMCPLQRIDWCIWHYRFGQCGKTKFISSKTHVLIYRNGDGPHTWNADDILVESDRSSKYNDSRTFYSETPGMRVPHDVWCDIPRVVGNAKERMPNHPNQIPERYLERLIKAFSSPGECVFDPFCGSGTSAAVAKRLGRWSVSIDKSPEYCADIVQRLESVKV